MRLAIILAFIGLVGVAQGAPPAKRVLLLHQAAVGEPIRAGFDDAFLEAMRSPQPEPIDLFEETIDTARFPGAERSQAVTDYLQRKYAGMPIDVIVAQGMPPLSFARQHRDLFGGPPIVTVVSPRGQFDHPRDRVTGLQGGFWINGIVDFAMALLPDTSTVIVVDGARQNVGEFQPEVERQLGERSRRVDLVYLRDLPLVDVLARVAAAPPHAIVLFVRQTMRSASQDVDQFDALAQISKASGAPVFTQVADFLGRGILGGYFWEYQADAKRLAAMARQIAAGANPNDIPIESATYKQRVDWRELQRWRIPESRVPAGTEILFRRSSFFVLYRRYVVAAAVVFVAQLALIGGLLTQRRRLRRAEAETRTSEARYRSVVETQTEMICRFLPDTTLTFVNDAYCRVCGKPPAELLGRKFIDLVPPFAREGVLRGISHAVQQVEGVHSHEHPVLLNDGGIGWHHWVNRAIRSSGGTAVELQGVGRDVTERRRAEEALVKAEARNTAMLRAVPDLMFVLTRDGAYVDYHARDETLLAVPPHQFVGRNVRDVMPPPLADRLMEAIDRAFEVDEPIVVEYELPVGHFEARLVRAGDDRVLSMVRDVTDAKRAHERNRDLAGRLIASQEVERQRIARELHDDLSQKLALLAIDIDRLSSGARRDRQRDERYQHLRALSAEIASDIHDLSYRLHPSKLETLGLLAAMTSLCRDMSHEGSVQVTFDHGPVPSWIDPSASLCVYRITQEALRNVARHSHARDAHVELKHENGALTLHVADSGIGFDPAEPGRAGLGLISMQERVAFLRGRLVIHSSPGRGTRVGVQIPLDQDAVEIAGAAKRAR